MADSSQEEVIPQQEVDTKSIRDQSCALDGKF